jgi:two-component system, NarL family, response regulator NreC
MTTIVLADDHALIREGLRAVLDGEPDCSVVGEAADGMEAVDLVNRLQPNVLIVDLMLPNLSGLEVIRQVRRRTPRTQVVALSMHANESYVLATLRNGAAAYVLKDASSTDIIQAVHEVRAGRHYLSPPLSQYALEAYIEKAKGALLDLYETLTTREREVLHLVAQGETTTAIAARLALSPRTVETHRTNLMRKLGLRTPTDLIRSAGLVLRPRHVLRSV